MEPIPLVHLLKRGDWADARRPSTPVPPPLPELSDASPTPYSPETARQQAESLIQQARAEADAIRQQAYQEGYQAGYKAGEADAHQQLQADYQQQVGELRQAVNAFLQQLQAEFEAYLRLMEQEMLALTLEIARKIVRDELRQHPEHVLGVIRDALRRVQGFGQVRVRVNPLDLELVRQNRAHLMTVIDSLEGLEIVEDRRVEPGGCIVETPQGIYDARIGTQFEEIERAVEDSPPKAA